MPYTPCDRRDFLKTLLASTTFLAASPRAGRPNVVLIMTDDQGYGDLGATGNPAIRTPHIDAMAGRSARMENFYVHPVCSPTRACLMTGRYNYRTRVVDTWVGRSMMEPKEVTVAELLRGAGYATGIFGKWHLGDNYPLRAMDQGFEESLVLRGGGIGQPPDPPGGEGKYTDPILFHNGGAVQAEGYCTDVYFNAAFDWMEKAHRMERNFFVYLPTNAPHSPFHDVPEDLYEAYLEEDLSNDRMPRDKGHQLPEKVNTDRRARIFSMITNIDDNIGRLFRKLESLKILDNTIVIFMVDNGPNTRRYVAGMRGMKSEVYEGGIRTPFYLHWPARLEPGRSSDRVAAHIDVLPTLLDACGVPMTEGLDGRSFLPLLTKEKFDWPDRTLYIQSHRGDVPVRYHHFAARNQRWKLLHSSGFGKESFEGEPKFELYDMAADPLEMNDVVEAYPDVVRSMVAEYDAWFDEVGSTRADNYAPPRIHVGTPHENPVVLTRQDWRHFKGKLWAKDSVGYWELFVSKPGSYRVCLRFSGPEPAGTATLHLSGQILSKSIEEGARECLFESVKLSQGPVRLRAEFKSGDRIKGPWFVNVDGPHQ
jgi:arylsulfatase A-like enzyme